MPQRAQLYRQDLAFIHQQGFSWYALKAATGLLALLRQHGVEKGLVIDLGCGPGTWQRHLVSAGYDAMGIDASPAMIRLARRMAPRARFSISDLSATVIERCSAVTSIGEVLSYALHTDKQAADLFQRVYKGLRPGGLFIFDVGTDGRLPGGTPLHGHWSGEGWASMLDAQYDSAHSILTRRITSFRRHGRLYRRSVEVHTLRLFKPQELEAMLNAKGFHVKRLKSFGPVRFQSGHAGFLARKPD